MPVRALRLTRKVEEYYASGKSESINAREGIKTERDLAEWHARIHPSESINAREGIKTYILAVPWACICPLGQNQ